MYVKSNIFFRMDTTERTTIRLPSELLRQARARAVREGRTLTSLIEEGVRSMLLPQPRSPAKVREALPISTHRGGLQPSIDLSDMSSLYELEDLERS